MENLWRDADAKDFEHSDLAMRVYTSRLLGQSDDLVLHGGGNTSVKSTAANIFGESEDILYVKGSGWDLKTIEEPGFAPARLAVLTRLAKLDSMTDTEMTRTQGLDDQPRCTLTIGRSYFACHYSYDSSSTHTDAVVAISNSPNGEQLLRDIYGERVLILPYIMPGFVLARQVYESTKDMDWKSIEGIVLLHHGLFTFNNSARVSYDKMIELVNLAEGHLAGIGALEDIAVASYATTQDDHLALARARQAASRHFKAPMIATWLTDPKSLGFSKIEGIAEIATRGPVTPDHTLQTKRIPAILDQDPVAAIDQFAVDYLAYFEKNTDGQLECLDPAPRYAVWKDKGLIIFSEIQTTKNHHRHHRTYDQSNPMGEALGGWTNTEQQIFELEYWELEQAKLACSAWRSTTAGSLSLQAPLGIGKASRGVSRSRRCSNCARYQSSYHNCFQTGRHSWPRVRYYFRRIIQRAVEQGVYGGIDILVSNAGSFPASSSLEDLESDFLNRPQLNFNSHVSLIRACTPYLKLGYDPAIVLMSSKNVPAPGPGAGAYSAAKSALTQIGRVAAMELGNYGIRVNMLHPNAVFDTGIWSDEVLT